MAALIRILENTDITSFDKGVIGHGVNCQHAMGSGVALAISRKWPIVRHAFMQAPKGAEMLGTTHIIRINDDLSIANMYTQVFYGNDGKKYADIKAIEKCVNDLFSYAESMGFCDIFIPQIGSKRGGLDWDTEVFPVINKCVQQRSVTMTLNICQYKE